jgi:hypothetical protein
MLGSFSFLRRNRTFRSVYGNYGGYFHISISPSLFKKNRVNYCNRQYMIINIINHEILGYTMFRKRCGRNWSNYVEIWCKNPQDGMITLLQDIASSLYDGFQWILIFDPLRLITFVQRNC